MSKNNSLIGKPIPRIEGKEAVQGKLVFATDMYLPGMLHGAARRCPFPRAKVLKIDTQPAEILDGVVAVITAKDIPGRNLHGQIDKDQPVLVGEGEIANMVGDPVAAVAAKSEKIARAAVDLIKVDYQELEPIIDAEKVLQDPENNRIHNKAVLGSFDFDIGDIKQGEKESDVVVEAVFHTPRQQPAYIETESCVAVPGSDASITIRGCSQFPQYLQQDIARIIGFKETQVRAVVPPIGGSFGGKQSMTVHGTTALLALKTGKPVKMMLTRQESMMLGAKRHPTRVNHRMGATKDGKITFLEADYLLDGGAYAWGTEGVLEFMGMSLQMSPYKIAHKSIHGNAVYTNNPMSGACRGFGAPQGVTVTELQIDRLAKKLGIDPVQFRLDNFLKKGDELDGLPMDGVPTSDAVMKNAIDKMGPLPQPGAGNKRVGRGFASALPKFDNGSVPVTGCRGVGATIEMHIDGSVTICSGVVEMGSGITTSIAQIVANELGLEIENVSVVFADTQRSLKSGPTLGSRSNYCTGNAVVKAAGELKKRLAKAASQMLGVESENARIQFSNERVHHPDDQSKFFTLAEVAEYCSETGVNMTATGWHVTDHAEIGYGYMTAGVDVEVNMDTGQIVVLNCVISQDVGKIINLLNAKAQIAGAVLMGIGWVLMEEVIVSTGETQSDSFNSYKIPTSLDCPITKICFIEKPSPTGPYGARGIGEAGMYTVPSAVLNAVSNAIDQEIFEFPLTPQNVYQLVHEIG